MSIDLIKNVFQNLLTYNSWSLQLLQIRNLTRGTEYFSREITLSPSSALTQFLGEISRKYCSEIDEMFETISDYDGSAIGKTIYKLNVENNLISNNYSLLIEAIANPDAEVDPLTLKARAYILKGTININRNERAIKLVSMKNPITTFERKFYHANGTFIEMPKRALSLRMSIDVVIVDDFVYMLTLAGENLFNMERAYKAICTNSIDTISNANIINDCELFSTIANQGHNPRKFISFNQAHLQRLQDPNIRNQISKKFNIPLDNDKFDISQDGASDKLIKILCARAMVEPFDNNPMEVAGAKRWE